MFAPVNRRTDVLIFGLVLIGLWLSTDALLIKFKALLAPLLIAQAWEETLETPGAKVKPWPWADTWPVARMKIPAHGINLPVLHGDAGNSLAFAPGHAVASAKFGTRGVAVISAHRDTHFAFLREVSVGEFVQLQIYDGSWRRYEIVSTRIVDSRNEGLSAFSTEETLLLVTCYPFNAIQARGPLRYVIKAVPV
jgi:sortase A